jgi:hypothetical protein
MVEVEEAAVRKKTNNLGWFSVSIVLQGKKLEDGKVPFSSYRFVPSKRTKR